MTGQVDEAGREARAERYATAWRISRGLSVQAWDPFIALADIEQAELRAERDRLADQVAAIRALHVEAKNPYQERTGTPGGCGHCSSQAYFTDGMGPVVWWPCPTIRALDPLVASSPTTPQPPEVSE